MTGKQIELLTRFKERIVSNLPITYKELKKDDPTLLYGIERHFGSLVKVCGELGISEDDMITKFGFSRNINKRTLSEHEIKERLLYLKSIGKLTTNSMRTQFDDNRLELSIKKTYGSVKEGLKHFGLERDYKAKTKRDILNEILKYQELGIDLCYSNMIQVDSALVSNVGNKYKSWNKFLMDNAIQFESKRKPYTKDSIKERLDAVLTEYGEINYSVLKKVDSSILTYAHTNYDSLQDFYVDMGYKPEDWLDFDSQKYKGRLFELRFKDVLEALDIPFIHNKYYNKKIRPDFQLNDGIWIDCKLSSWTQTIKDTVIKYSDHCEKLIIVYLRGNKRKIYEYKEYNVEFRKIDYYFPLLREIGRQDLISEIINILNTSESVTTERLTS